MIRGRTSEGQATVEMLVLLPVLVIAALVAVQVVGMLAAASRAQDSARQRALVATGGTGATARVEGVARPPRLLPLGPRPDAITVRVGVRIP